MINLQGGGEEGGSGENMSVIACGEGTCSEERRACDFCAFELSYLLWGVCLEDLATCPQTQAGSPYDNVSHRSFAYTRDVVDM